ncbi:mRNA 3'-end-processing protein rna14 [Massospora cicadina]|nr:mRNA 3'-end-processing protein rna14 [Massospora cicadina]
METFTSLPYDNTYSWAYWNHRVATALKTGGPESVRETYECLLEKYPTSVQHWLDYVDYELKHRQLAKAEALFTRCTPHVISLDIFKLYLQYIKQTNSTPEGLPRGPTERHVITLAYEYALLRVGFDKDAGPIWLEYIAFLKRVETYNAWEQQHAVDKIRKVYHQATAIPTLLLDTIWKDYEQFELSVNRATAKRLIAERSPTYAIARAALRELRALTDPIAQLKATAPPPSWSAREIKLADDWQAYLSWEKSNPLRLENTEALNARVIFAYTQALLSLRFYPEFWVDLACFYVKVDRKKDAANTFALGCKALPSSVLLNCAYAEYEELQRREKEAHAIYDQAIKSLTGDLERVQAKFGAKLAELDAPLKDAGQEGQESREIDGEVKELLRRREKQREKQRAEIEEAKAVEVDAVKRRITLVWLSYMRSARRCEGIKGLRRVFGEARKSGHATYHVFVEAALLEHFNQADPKIPDNIFQLGQRHFPTEPGFVAQHLEYLIQKKDPNNARALFEKSIDGVPKGRALPLWEKISRFEAYLGDASNLERTHRRVSEAYPHIPPSQLIADRLSYVDAYATEELGYRDTRTRAQPKVFVSQLALEGLGLQNGKKNSLDSIASDRFTRPDFSRWTNYKPSSEPTRIASPNPSAPALPATSHPLELPEAVAYFLSQIPKAHEYVGPAVDVEHLLKTLDGFLRKDAAEDGPRQGFAPPPAQFNFPPPPFIRDHGARPLPNYGGFPGSNKRSRPSSGGVGGVRGYTRALSLARSRCGSL